MHNKILLKHKKEWNFAICNNMDGPGGSYEISQTVEDRCSVCVRVRVRMRVCCHSVVSDSLWPPWTLPARLLCQWNFPGKNTGACCHFLLQRIFPIQGSNPLLLQLLHWQADFLSLHYPGSQILYVITSTWSLKKWNKWMNTTKQNRLIDTENKVVVTSGKRGQDRSRG